MTNIHETDCTIKMSWTASGTLENSLFSVASNASLYVTIPTILSCLLLDVIQMAALKVIFDLPSSYIFLFSEKKWLFIYFLDEIRRVISKRSVFQHSRFWLIGWLPMKIKEEQMLSTETNKVFLNAAWGQTLACLAQYMQNKHGQTWPPKCSVSFALVWTTL